MSRLTEFHASIEALKKSIEDVDSTVQNLRMGFELSGREMAREFDRVRDAVELGRASKQKLNAVIAQNRREYNLLKKEKKENTKRGKELNEAIKKETKARNDLNVRMATANQYLTVLKQKKRELSETTGKATRQTTLFGGSLRGVMGVARQLAGVFGFGFGLYGVMRLFRSAVQTIRDFELAQKQLEAVTGATQGQMDNFAREAIRVGASSIYGAEGVTKLQVQLAKMGFTIPQINDMAESITLLAMATQEDLAKAAETVAFTIRAYQMDSRETKRVTDAMAKSFTSSALDLEKFRQSIKYIGPIANQANFTLEETVAILGKVADAGISGSLAGTSMRNIIFQLSDATSNLTKRTGIAVQNFDDFTAALWKLNEQGMKLEDVFDVMDRRAASVFTLLIESVGSLDEFRHAIMRSGGEAERMANIQMQSLSYQTQLAKRAWEGFILSLDKGEGSMTRLFKGVLSSFTGTMENLTYNLNRQSRAIAKEIIDIDFLVASINNVSISTERRIDMLKRLKENYPEYFGMLDMDIEKTEELTDAHADALETLKRSKEFQEAVEHVKELERGMGKGVERIDAFRMSIQKMIIAHEKMVQGWKENDFEGVVGGALRFLMADIERWYRHAVKSYGLAEEAVDDYEGKITGAIDRRDELVWGESMESIIDYFEKAGVVAEFVSQETSEFNKEIKKLKDAGVPDIKAVERAYKNVGRSIERRIEELEEFAEGNTKVTFQIELLKRAANELHTAFSDALSAAKDHTRETADIVRHEQRMAEFRAQQLYEGIRLEQELADIRKRFAEKQLQFMEGDAEDRAKAVLNAEYQLAIQKIRTAKMREEHQLTEESIRQQRELQKVMNEIYDEQLRRTEMAVDEFDTEARYKIEEERIKKHYERRSEEVSEGLRKERAAIKDEYGRRIKDMSIADKANEEEVAKHHKALAQLKSERKAKLAAIDKKANQDEALLREQQLNDLLALDKRFVNERINIAQQQSDRRMRLFEIEHEKERTAFNAKWRSDKARRDFERKQHEEMLKMRKQELEILLTVMEAEEKRASAESPEIDFSGLRRDIEDARSEIELLTRQIADPEFRLEEWNRLRDTILGVMSDLGGAITNLARERELASRRERELLDRNLSETQRALETELRLREQGFASNVQAKQKELAELEAMRQEAEKKEEEAIRRRQISEAAVQSMNILTSAAQIIKHETLGKGAIGLITAAGAIASMYALWRGVRSQAEAVTKYEKGGHFILGGKSHAQGGSLIAPGHEGQKGELVSVFNRSATRKHAPQIKALTDAINMGAFPENNVQVFADNKDIRAIRKHLERGTETYANGYRIIKRGNKTIRCRLN